MKILVTLDGSHFSEGILDTVRRTAPPLHADVELMTVGRSRSARETPVSYAVRQPVPQATTTGTPLNVPSLSDILPHAAESREQAVERVEGEALQYLHSLQASMGDIPTTVYVAFANDPADAIIARAREQGVDMIAMATHGHTGVRHAVTGSVCEKVIRSGVAPVLVVRPKE